jgi:hypothetical protein
MHSPILCCSYVIEIRSGSLFWRGIRRNDLNGQVSGCLAWDCPTKRSVTEGEVYKDSAALGNWQN